MKDMIKAVILNQEQLEKLIERVTQQDARAEEMHFAVYAKDDISLSESYSYSSKDSYVLYTNDKYSVEGVSGKIKTTIPIAIADIICGRFGHCVNVVVNDKYLEGIIE